MQDLKGSIRVFCRIRPPAVTGDQSESCIDFMEDGNLAVYDPARVSAPTSKYGFSLVFVPGASTLNGACWLIVG